MCLFKWTSVKLKSCFDYTLIYKLLGQMPMIKKRLEATVHQKYIISDCTHAIVLFEFWSHIIVFK